MITARDIAVVESIAGTIVYATNHPPMKIEIPNWFEKRNRDRMIESVKSIYLEAVNDRLTAQSGL